MYLEKYNLKGKIAVVTGGTKGIGLATAAALAEAGAQVVLLTNEQEQIPDAKKFMAAQGYHAECLVADVTSTTSINEVADYIEQNIGNVAILVCNAGIALSGMAAEDVSDEVYLKVIDVNLNGVFRCCRAFGRYMLQRGAGAIVNVGSMSGIINNIPQNQCYYNASKAGVHHLTKSLAAEWATRGVRVNCVAPTYIATEMTREVLEENTISKIWLQMTPMQRVGQPDEIASVILFLASEAASLLTGSVVVADGGYTLW